LLATGYRTYDSLPKCSNPTTTDTRRTFFSSSYVKKHLSKILSNVEIHTFSNYRKEFLLGSGSCADGRTHDPKVEDLSPAIGDTERTNVCIEIG
jgi:hypothetical protein